MGESRQPSRASAIVTLASIGVLLLTAAAPPVAQAVLIESGITTIFQDNFEAVSPGSPPAWSSTTATTLVQNSTTPPAPGPAEGAQYLRLDRPAGVEFQQTVAQVDFGAVSSGTLTASFRVFVPAAAPDDVVQISLSPNPAPGNADIFGAPVWLTTVGSNVRTYVSAIDTSTGVTFTKGAWQIWSVAYTFNPSTNDDTFTVSVNGMASASINAGGFANVADPANLRYLNFRVGAAPGVFYLDAVPEPGSMAIVGLVAVVGAGLRRARRARTA